MPKRTPEPFIKSIWANGSERTFAISHVSILRKERNPDGTFTHSIVVSGVEAPLVISQQLYDKLMDTLSTTEVYIDTTAPTTGGSSTPSTPEPPKEEEKDKPTRP